MTDEILRELIEFIENASPVIWSTLLKQVYVDAFAGAMYAVAMKGWIKRPNGLDFHHPDYSRPYYGAWVTSMEHRHIHAGIIDCPPCIDYCESVEKYRQEAIRDRNRKGAEAANRKRWGYNG